MSRQTIKISGKSHPISEQASSHWKFEVRPGGWVIGESEQGKRVRFQMTESRGRFSASSSGRLWLGEWQKKSFDSSGKGSSSDDQDLIAQFPGKVRKVITQKGAEVNEGDPLLLVEAMKMEFAIKAPFAGQVLQILVQEGQQISPGDRFVDLKQRGGGDE